MESTAERRAQRAGGRRVGQPRAVRHSGQVFRYLARGVSLNFLVAFLVLEAVQAIIFTVRATEDLGLEILIIFPVLLRAFLQATTYSIPIALLFGTSLLVGRLAADRETLAFRAFGISPIQVLLPAAAVGAALTLVSLVINLEWAPRMRYANRQVDELLIEQLGYLGEGYNREVKSGEMTLWIGHHDGPLVEGVFASLSTSGGILPIPEKVFRGVEAPSYPMYVVAEKGLVRRGTGENAGTVVLALKEAQAFLDDDLLSDGDAAPAGTEPLVGAPVPAAAVDAAIEATGAKKPERRRSSNFLDRIRFESIEMPLKFKKRTPGPKDMGLSELFEYTEDRRALLAKATAEGDRKTAEWVKKDYDYAVTELHRRLALSACTLSFPVVALLIGLSLASQNRLLAFSIASTVVPAGYFSLELLGNYYARCGVVPWLSEEMGTVGLALLGLVLFWRLHCRPRR